MYITFTKELYPFKYTLQTWEEHTGKCILCTQKCEFDCRK